MKKKQGRNVAEQLKGPALRGAGTEKRGEAPQRLRAGLKEPGKGHGLTLRCWRAKTGRSRPV